MNAVGEMTLRSWSRSDLGALVRYANNRNVWLNLRNLFPHPYTPADAQKWIERCEASSWPTQHFAIELNQEAIGGIGCELLGDVHCKTAEIGYWLGEPFWGRGIATDAVKQMTEYAFTTFDLERLQATVFGWNAASARVLEKAAYQLEGRLHQSIFKDGRLTDSLLYARLRQAG
jgi:ribosomal-protein-alanine N-acetyltransferase